MEYFKIQNNGELDIRLISLMGGSTKTGDETKIGRFGTGLKYSLSYLIRNNIDFKIFVGTREIPITTEKEVIQNKEFEILYIDGQRTSITSSMGLDWKGWMIVREIYCNALDEGGEAYGLHNGECYGVAGATTFFIQSTGEVKETISTWKDYFVNEIKPLCETDKFRIFPPSKNLKVYKNGILIHENKTVSTVYSYDLLRAELNELREYQGSLSWDIADAIASMDKVQVELFLSTLKEKDYEYDLNYDYADFGKQWAEAIGQGKIISDKTYEKLEAKDVITESEKAGLIIVPESLFKALAKKHKHLSAVRLADKVNAFYETMDDGLMLKIKSALAILESCGYIIDGELSWIVGVFGDANTFARINIDEKLIMFSQELARKSMFELITCIIEENEHYITHFQDCTRQFQQHFINLYAKQILEKNAVTL